MVTIRRGYWASKVAHHNEGVKQRLERQATGTSTADGAVWWISDPVDLRGLPAIGRNVAGAIRHSQPEQALIGKQPR